VGERDRVRLDATGDVQAAARACGAIPAVHEASASDGSIELVVDDARTMLPDLLQAVTSSGVRIRSVEVMEPNLEAVFLHLTGKALRD
jgi:ABC-2 type transport system ATP-binding protein